MNEKAQDDWAREEQQEKELDQKIQELHILKRAYEAKRHARREQRNTHDLLAIFPQPKEHWRIKTFMIPEQDYYKIAAWKEQGELALEIPEDQPKSSMELVFSLPKSLVKNQKLRHMESILRSVHDEKWDQTMKQLEELLPKQLYLPL